MNHKFSAEKVGLTFLKVEILRIVIRVMERATDGLEYAAGLISLML